MRTRNWALLLLLVPFIALLWPPFFASLQPTLFGIPYFLWYQLLWSILAAVVVGAVYLIQNAGETE